MELALTRGLPLLLSLEPPEGRQLGRYHEAAQRQGRAADLAGFSLSRYVCIGRTDAEAEAQVDSLLPLLMARRRWAPPMSFAEARVAFLRDQAIVGGPDRCLEQMRRLVVDTGISHLRCVFNGNGALAPEAALAGMELFAREAMSAARAIPRR
jgi:alkanesulfonate monooxygenase SsuD/methylene tetrahydromethanopterin reductase-like flavin-dependent oxidoreductase (luciferase family)